MTCTGCGAETAPGFAFCPRCGRRLPRACGACGFACDAEFAFCPRCGGALGQDAGAPAASPPASPAVKPAAKPAEPGRESDRRQVTILFADLSGFTSLAERLDPEEVRAFQSALFETLAQAIKRYDGFVEKFVGDAVLAIFGAPVAHEDDPERALETALDILERGEALSRTWAPRLGQPVTLHVAVHSGPVVAGSLGAGAGAAYAVTGDAVNTTARLLAAAEAGTVLVSEATRALTHHRFAFEPAGEVALRGKGGVDVKNAKFKVTVIGPHGEKIEVPTLVESQQTRGYFLKADRPGEYKVVVEAEGKDADPTNKEPVKGTATARFLAYADDIENLRPAADHEFLTKLAQTGGGRFRLADERAFLQLLDELQTTTQKERARAVEYWPPWDLDPGSSELIDQLPALWRSAALGCFLLFVALVCSEWALRRMWGMV